MDKHFLNLRRYYRRHRYEAKRIHKEWVGFGTGLRAVSADLFVVFQLLLIGTVYAFFARNYPIFFYVCVGVTALTGLGILLFEDDVQSKISWCLLFCISFGSGFIVYFLSRREICYFWHRRYFSSIKKRVKSPVNDYTVSSEKMPSGNYLSEKGYLAYCGTDGKYYGNARQLMDNIIARIDGAEKFVFIEFFIVADGVFLDRLISIFRRKAAQGVEIYMLYDDVGSAGVFSSFVKKQIKAAGVKIKPFHKLFSPFYFGLNYRDHRKIVVVDGKTGYTGGINLIDDCANQRKMEGVWKDSGIRIDGAAVDGLSAQFIRQWQFATREKLDSQKYLNKFDAAENCSLFIPYAGGPEMQGNVCRSVYRDVVLAANEKLYIMTPYLVPDSRFMKLLFKKAAEGVDVRVVLPGVPDYRYIYKITLSNARKLIKRGVKVYYSGGEFVHSKVMLTEQVAVVGSVNLDMRAFYQELDNGMVTDDEIVKGQIQEDFNRFFEFNEEAELKKFNPVSKLIELILKLVSPLM